mgnify:CR=1 FL=1
METQNLKRETLHHALESNDVNLLCELAKLFDVNALPFEPAPWEAKLLSLITEHYCEGVVALKTLYAADLGNLLEGKGHKDMAGFFYKKADDLGYVHGAFHVGDYERAAKIYRHLFESRYDGMDYIPYPTEDVRPYLNAADKLFNEGKVKESCEEYKKAVDVLNDVDAVICVHELETGKPLFLRKSGIQEVGDDYVKVQDGLPVGKSDGKICLTYDEICNPNNDDDNHEYRDYFIKEDEAYIKNFIELQEERKEDISRWESHLANPSSMKEMIVMTIRVLPKNILSVQTEDGIIIGETTKGKYLFYIDGSGYRHKVRLSK